MLAGLGAGLITAGFAAAGTVPAHDRTIDHAAVTTSATADDPTLHRGQPQRDAQRAGSQGDVPRSGVRGGRPLRADGQRGHPGRPALSAQPAGQLTLRTVAAEAADSIWPP